MHCIYIYISRWKFSQSRYKNGWPFAERTFFRCLLTKEDHILNIDKSWILLVDWGGPLGQFGSPRNQAVSVSLRLSQEVFFLLLSEKQPKRAKAYQWNRWIVSFGVWPNLHRDALNGLNSQWEPVPKSMPRCTRMARAMDAHMSTEQRWSCLEICLEICSEYQRHTLW